MKTLFSFLFLAAALGAQTNYPGSLDTDTTLLVAKDNLATTLTSPMLAGDTVAIVKSSTGWAVNMMAYICDGTPVNGACPLFEEMLVTNVAGNVLTVTRAQGGTSAVGHAAGVVFSNAITAGYQKAAKSALIAIETALGANLANVPASPLLSSKTYNFSALTSGAGVTVSGGNLIAGNNTLTFATVPPGVNGVDPLHYLYISGGVGTAEACLITGGSGVAGQANGQIIVNCANTHSGAWTIQSATAGIQEAIRTIPFFDGYMVGPSVYIPAGKWPIYGPINVDNFASLIGAGSNSTILQKAFPTGDVIYIGDSSATLRGVGGVYRDFSIRPLQGVTDTGGYAIRVKYRYNPTIENVTLYGDAGIGRFNNGIKFDSCLTFSLLNTKILNVTNIGLELAATNPDQVTGRIVAVDVTSPGTTNDMVWFHGNILSMFIDGLQMQGGFRNWHINTTGGQFTESQIANVIFDSATSTAFQLDGTGSTFKLSFANIELSTIAGVPSTTGMTFDGTGAGVFSQITITNLTGGVNASNSIGTALFILSASNFLLSNSHIQGAGGGVGDTSLQIQGTTSNIVLTGNVLGHAYDGGITGSQAYRAVYVPSGTHTGMTITGNRIYGSSVALGIAGAHTGFHATGNNLDTRSGTTTSFTGTGTAYFENPNDPAGLNGVNNYIATETGANNAIAAALTGASLAAGLKVQVLIGHTLQIGANTFNLNAGGALGIKSHLNVANNIAAAYAVGSVVTLWYDGTRWLDLSQ